MEATGKYVMRDVVKSEERMREAAWDKGWLLKHKAEMRRFVCGSQWSHPFGTSWVVENQRDAHSRLAETPVAFMY